MKNVYFPGETIFLYATFAPGLSIVSMHNSELTSKTATDNSKYGLFINGEWVSYESYMRYYSDYLIDTAWDTTYYALNSYYSNTYLSGYNWTSNYYVHSLEDLSDSEKVVIEQISHSMMCRILHDEDGIIYEDLPWTAMQRMGNNEFYYNFCLPYEMVPGQYQIIYKSVYSEKYFDPVTKMYFTDEQLAELKLNKYNKNRVAHSMEMFYVNNYSSIYEDVVKISGYVNYKYTTVPAEDVRVSVFETNTETNIEYKVYQSLTNREGYWEAYLYPNQYKFVFSRNGYQDITIFTEITDDNNHLLFETISLDNSSVNRGTGMFRITDSFLTKTGQPLYNLNISISSTLNPDEEIVSITTNEQGIWEAYLNDGYYLMKVTGIVEGADFSRAFRLKVLPDGKFFMDNLSANLLTDANMPILNNGLGKFKIKDVIQDRWNNPINEVQVNVFYSTDVIDEKNIRAQDYTDANGEYVFFLDPGTYIFEFYHPNFNIITETKVIGSDGSVTTTNSSKETGSIINHNATDNSKFNNGNYYLQTGTFFFKK